MKGLVHMPMLHSDYSSAAVKTGHRQDKMQTRWDADKTGCRQDRIPSRQDAVKTGRRYCMKASGGKKRSVRESCEVPGSKGVKQPVAQHNRLQLPVSALDIE